jgi:glycosyltransferase involved in cell wall biosynthesis
MACGLPGLISAADGAVEFVSEGQNGFVISDPSQVDDLSALLARVLGLPEASRAICGAAARETVLPLTWEAHLGAWLQLLTRA